MDKREEELIINNVNLIFFSLKHLNLFTKNGIEKYYDVGMIGLVKGAKKYDHSLGLKPSSYLTRCIINEILYEKRRENRPTKLNIDNTISLSTIIHENIELEDIINSNIDIENEILENESKEELYQAIEQLNDIEKFVIINTYGLYNHKIMKQDEMAKLLNVERSSVSRIKVRAIKKLRGVLNEKKNKRK